MNGDEDPECTKKAPRALGPAVCVCVCVFCVCVCVCVCVWGSPAVLGVLGFAQFRKRLSIAVDKGRTEEVQAPASMDRHDPMF